MSYRFLPWVRRGLAAELHDPDGIVGDLPARARVPVRLTLSHGPQVGLDLELYGPGDVTGLDQRAIVRTEPRPGTTNFAPDEFAAIEFDPPDLPWLLSPAAGGTSDRLRPWLALVVVARQPGVEIDVVANRPLPRLTIEAPASPAAELPDLAESWAWAHAHMVETQAAGSVPERLAAEPDLNVSRLLCPRRLEPDRDYAACLVPTTKAGLLAGLGQDPGDAATTGPAWSGEPSVVLPLYYHWEFRTGPAGDFESLARKLVPRPIPPRVGRRPMFVGAAGDALPTLAADAGGVLDLEGALGAPGSGAEAVTPPAPTLVDALVRLLDAPSEHVADGAPDDAEAVGPPIYGQWPVRTHTVPATATDPPRWLRELNVDPRHRTAAGLGSQVVRENQERFVEAAWKQVGDVLAANRLLDRARLMRRIGERMHTRHVAPLREDALFALTAPVHERIMLGGETVERTLQASLLPGGAGDPAFRRMAAPQNQVLRRATRVGGGDGATVPVTVLADLARGELKLDLLAGAPDGIVGSTLIAELPGAVGGQVSGGSLGLPGQVDAAIFTQLAGAKAALEQQPAGAVVLRPDTGLRAVVTEGQLAALTGQIGTMATLHGTIGQVLGQIVRRPPGAGGLAGGTALHGVVADVAGHGLAIGPIGGPGPIVVTFPTGPVIHVDPPLTATVSIAAMVTAFQAQVATFTPAVVSLRPAPAPLELSGLRSEVVSALDPVAVIEQRVRGRLQVGGGLLADHDLGDRVRPTDDLGPVMAGPLLDEALYRDLAAYDQDRFLPGAGQIPGDTVTLLETNPRFVEAFLVGANHEMNRELLWRRYPTDRRGTPFRRFWDRVDAQTDIGPIHEFAPDAALGKNSLGQRDDPNAPGTGPPEGSLVLLVRGELLKRYPNSVVYAVPAGADGRLDPALPITLPVFAGRLEPDLVFVGFDFARQDVEPAPGWFFVIQEQPSEPRFGLDVPPPGGSGSAPATWADLDWSHVGVPPGGYLRLAATTLAGQTKALADRPGPASSIGSAEFGRNAGHMAAITFQRPFRAAVHSAKVLAAVDATEGPG